MYFKWRRQNLYDQCYHLASGGIGRETDSLSGELLTAERMSARRGDMYIQQCK